MLSGVGKIWIRAATHLDIAQHVVLDRGEGNGAEDIWQ